MTDDERKEVEEAVKAALKARVDLRLDLKLILRRVALHLEDVLQGRPPRSLRSLGYGGGRRRRASFHGGSRRLDHLNEPIARSATIACGFRFHAIRVSRDRSRSRVIGCQRVVRRARSAAGLARSP
jgi:hypothetical protein